jgi:hypothetical protein
MSAAITPRAWLVIAADGYEAVFKDRAAAEKYATQAHGVVMPLYAVVPVTETRCAGPCLAWPSLEKQ